MLCRDELGVRRTFRADLSVVEGSGNDGEVLAAEPDVTQGLRP